MKERFSALSLYLKSILIGSAVVIPGISAGTIAFLFGIYDLILNSITKLLSREFWTSFRNLFWVGLGTFTGIVLFVLIMSYLVLPYTLATIFVFSLFAGFILGSVLLVKKMIKEPVVGSAKILSWVLLFAGFALILAIFILSPSKGELTAVYTKEELTTPSFLTLLFFANFMAGGFMLMPGISGSAVLLSWGIYAPMIFALKSLLILPIIIVALGNLVGIFFWAGLISFLLKRYNTLTLFVILGLILGSTVQVAYSAIALIDGSVLGIVMTIVGFALGFGGSLPFNKTSKKT